MGTIVPTRQIGAVCEGGQADVRTVTNLLLILTSSVLGYLLLEVVVRVLDTPPQTDGRAPAAVLPALGQPGPPF